MIPPPVIQALGFPVSGYERVSGGDINEAFALHSGGDLFFLKLNRASAYSAMLEKEAAGLNHLRAHTRLKVPAVIQCSEAGGYQFLLLEWLPREASREDGMILFGTALAELHRNTSSAFGWDADNFIGSLPQVNTLHATWSEFYAQCRIGPLVHQLAETGLLGPREVRAAERLAKEWVNIFPDEPPALLHGDLWGGNYFFTTGGTPAIIDPAVYYGHREMDIGMSKLFGGFSPPFYEAYHAAYPLPSGWEERLPLTQLYPLLVHALLFGGHYIAAVSKILIRFGGR